MPDIDDITSQSTAAHPTFRPVARPEAVVQGPNVRFTVLTPRLIRIEHDPAGAFEDRPSQAFWCRDLPVPEFDAILTQDTIAIETEALRLSYAVTPRGLAWNTLSIDLKESGTGWRYGAGDPLNLRGTARTLDNVDGPVHLGPGLMSRAGWAVVDDSYSLVFDDKAPHGAAGWLVTREAPEASDLYFFGYGHDYLGCLRDFFQVAGPVPLMPRWILGNWWSRYWAYSQAELRELVEEFQAHEVPLSVLIVDMDWHITRCDTASGWTGYTWNPSLFPEPETFIGWLHEQGLRTALNLHPADGVHPHEARYLDMAARLGIDPDSGMPVAFDATDPEFVSAYFELLHHPLEEQGVDFWWLDWQQGTRSRLSGLDPLWWLNHLHFYDAARDGRTRPFIFSRWGGLGNHRYPIGFSGDTVVSWASLAFQPYMTATAANVGYGWWSHDIGGHMRGIEDPELFARWVQFGALSPILRLHSTKNPYHERHPWGYDREIECIVREAMQLRHALIPYLYSAAWHATQHDRLLILPIYYLHPEAEAAYHCPQQYYFGPDLIAAPYVSPRDADTRLARQTVWLPDGEWYHFFSGEHLAGGHWHTRYGALDDIPLFARAGAIVPLAPRVGWGGVDNPTELTLHLFAGASGAFDLYEDDGTTLDYLSGAYAVTRFRQAWHGHTLELVVEPAEGDVSLVPQVRTYHLAIQGVMDPGQGKIDITLDVDGEARPPDVSYNPAAERLVVHGVQVEPGQRLTLRLCASGCATLLSRRDRRAETVRRMLRAFHLDTGVKGAIDYDLPRLLDDPAALMEHSTRLSATQLYALSTALVKREA
ncbi:MAG: DUF5110 domain-containing protein [Anaerolineae bacterium]|nr:DUF5110 domain-containing protein [Anaerolineae bacterium]